MIYQKTLITVLKNEECHERRREGGCNVPFTAPYLGLIRAVAPNISGDSSSFDCHGSGS
jgi:hypothetical protein